jgi:hypothetical protein
MTPQLARRLVAAALVLGVAGNWLLRVDHWRAGLVLWLLGVLGVAFSASAPTEASDPTARRERGVLFAAAALLALLLVLRDGELLYGLNLFAILVVSALIAWRARGRPIAELEPRDAVSGGIATATALVVGAPTLALRDAAPAAIDAEQRRAFGGFGIGAVVAAPVLLVVALLLGSADPLFAGFLENASTLLDASLVGHVAGSALAAWIAAGAIRGAFAPVGLGITLPRVDVRLPFPTVAPLLGGLALLLSAWVGLQVRTLFGGAEYVAATGGVTVAEYARQGFFELIVIAGIVLAALLVADEVLDRAVGRERASFRAVGLVLLGLVGAVLVSALLRLGLYLRYYGLTEDRVLALAVLVWVAAVLSWFGWTVLRQARARFAPGVLLLSAIWLGALNLVNPERWIVETNLRRAERGLEFDAAYHARLSGDALPTLLRGLDRLGPEQATAVRAEISRVWAERAVESADWREWSLPHVLALRRTGN